MVTLAMTDAHSHMPFSDFVRSCFSFKKRRKKHDIMLSVGSKRIISNPTKNIQIHIRNGRFIMFRILVRMVAILVHMRNLLP